MKKFILTALMGLFAFNIQAQSLNTTSIYQNFLPQYQKKTIALAEDYRKGSPHPLDMRIFDIANPTLKNFLQNSKHAVFSDIFLAVTYYDKFKVNGVNTPFCFVMYDSNKKELLNNYLAPPIFSKLSGKVHNSFMSKSLFDQDSLIEYMVYHEFGHCAIFNTEHFGRTNYSNDREHEMLADMFAIAHFLLNKNEPINIERIIKINDQQKPDDPHSNSIALQIFYNDLKDYIEKNPDKKPNNAYELFSLTREIYNKIDKKQIPS